LINKRKPDKPVPPTFLGALSSAPSTSNLPVDCGNGVDIDAQVTAPDKTETSEDAVGSALKTQGHLELTTPLEHCWSPRGDRFINFLQQ